MLGFGSIGELSIAALREMGVRSYSTLTARVDFSFRLLAATHEFATDPTDTPLVNVPFRGTLQRTLRVDRTIVSGSGFGAMSASWGELELINADGYYDDLIQYYAMDGRRVVVTIGQLGRPYNSYRTIFDGTASGWSIEEDVLRIALRDNGYKLEVPASKTLYGGTGGLDGGTDLKGKRKPLAFGAVENCSPVLLIPAEQVYQLHDGPVNAITAVYDRGSALTVGSDYADSVQLRAATVAAGSFATCIAEGMFRLGSTPAGTVTANVQGDKTGGTYVSTTGTIIRRLLARSTPIADPGGLVVSSFTALEAAQPAVIGYFLGSDATATVGQVFGELLNGIGAWGDFRRDGLFQVGRLTGPSDTARGRYTSTEIIEIGRLRLPSAIDPTPWRWRVAWGRNWTVQTDLSGSVPASRVSYLAEEVRAAAASSDTIKSSHLLAQDPEPLRSFFRDEADASAEAARLLALYGERRSLYRVSLKLQPYLLDIGHCVWIQYPRWDLTDGKMLCVVGLSEDPDSGRIEITAFG